jgi:hypothetical protein
MPSGGRCVATRAWALWFAVITERPQDPQAMLFHSKDQGQTKATSQKPGSSTVCNQAQHVAAGAGEALHHSGGDPALNHDGGLGMPVQSRYRWLKPCGTRHLDPSRAEK